jgi:epoxyqueuosine reductase
LTIENKGSIPDDLKGEIGDWFFGCDVCQVICPHNHLIDHQEMPVGKQIFSETIPLTNLFYLDELAFTQKFQDSSLSRAKRQGFLRNAAIVLGNQKHQPALNVLEQAIKQEHNPIIVDACRWAIEKIKGHKDSPANSFQKKL